jgi:hypothetical protein
LPQDFVILEKFWLLYNTPEQENNAEKKELLFKLLINYEKFTDGFKNFSIKLQKNGELAHNLMTFISKIV